jgi:processive 1,2-diacylglycerol beta-glucosyltransferase
VIIGTHFFPLSVLGRARSKGRLPCPVLGVVTDYTAHAFWIDPGVDAYCVGGEPERDVLGAPSNGAAQELIRHGVPLSAIRHTGIPVRASFGCIVGVDEAALAPSPLPRRVSVLVTSGGFGIGPLEDALCSFVGLPHLELTVVCGADDRRRAAVEALVTRHRIRARVIGFERDMPARMAEAHLVLGKPGGLTVSESLAAGRPMALMGTCPGQEAHNATWLERRGAAVSVDPARAGLQIEALRAAGRLADMAHAARRLGVPDAASNVLDVALAHLAPRSRAA